MIADTRTVAMGGSGGPAPSMTLDLPHAWDEVPAADAMDVADTMVAAFSDGRTLSSGITSNVVVTAAVIPDGTDLEGWQSGVRDAQLSSLPDLQVLDDRRLIAADAPEQWYTASVMSDSSGVTVLTRRWSRLLPGLGLTLTLTTLPLVDAEHAALLDAIAASWALTAPTTEDPDAHA